MGISALENCFVGHHRELLVRAEMPVLRGWFGLEKPEVAR